MRSFSAASAVAPADIAAKRLREVQSTRGVYHPAFTPVGFGKDTFTPSTPRDAVKEVSKETPVQHAQAAWQVNPPEIHRPIRQALHGITRAVPALATSLMLGVAGGVIFGSAAFAFAGAVLGGAMATAVDALNQKPVRESFVNARRQAVDALKSAPGRMAGLRGKMTARFQDASQTKLQKDLPARQTLAQAGPILFGSAQEAFARLVSDITTDRTTASISESNAIGTKSESVKAGAETPFKAPVAIKIGATPPKTADAPAPAMTFGKAITPKVSGFQAAVSRFQLPANSTRQVVIVSAPTRRIDSGLLHNVTQPAGVLVFGRKSARLLLAEPGKITEMTTPFSR